MNQATHRVAVNFEIYTEDGEEKALASFCRPQDFRVKDAHWQYYTTFISAPTAFYEVHAYARRWQGPGKDFAELEHDRQPTPEEIADLVLEAANGMGGFPIGIDQDSLSVAWDDPIDEDDFLDSDDDPDDFAYLDDDQEELFDAIDGQNEDEDDDDWFATAPDVPHPAGNTQACPTCGAPMRFTGVMQMGNFLTGEPWTFAGRWQCGPCRALVAEREIDQIWAATQWQRQAGPKDAGQ